MADSPHAAPSKSASPSGVLARLPQVAFDEAGNTGQNLLDPEQPFFALAAVCMDEQDVSRILALADMPQMSEAKFARLRRTRRGREKLLRVFDDPAMTAAHVKALVYDKAYMVTSKIVDLLLEPLWAAQGRDMYAEGAQYLFAFVLHRLLPAILGRAAQQQILRCFVDLVRDKNDLTVAAFYAQVDSMCDVAPDEPLTTALALLASTQRIVRTAIRDEDVTAMDPAVPAFIQLAAQWTYSLGVPFEILHDTSIALERVETEIAPLLSLTSPPEVHEGIGAPVQFPIMATAIRFADSRQASSLQVADLCAGGLTALISGAARHDVDGFVESLRTTRFAQLSYTPIVAPDASMFEAEEFPRGDRGRSLEHVIRLIRGLS